MKHLFLIRHGQTDFNKLNKPQGSLNIPLNSEGIKQATKTTEFLVYIKNALNINFDLILSSTMQRAKETAEIIQKEIKTDIVYDDNLAGISGGKIQGYSLSELKSDAFYDEYFYEKTIYEKKNIIEQNLIKEIPKVFIEKYGCESIKSLKARIKKILKYINKTLAKNIIIITHDSFIKYFNQVVLNVKDNLIGDMSGGINCHLTYYQIKNKKYKLICMPSSKHLC